MIDIIREIEAIQREVGTARSRPARAAPSGSAAPTTRPIEDVWDALTNPERIGRWFLPISGDYRLGGRYQLEGNAGGEIVACERPNRLQVTWVYGETAVAADVSEVEVRLTPAGDEPRPCSSWSTPRSCPRRCGTSSGRAPSASAGTAACSGWRCTCAASPSATRGLAGVGRGARVLHAEQPGVGRCERS